MSPPAPILAAVAAATGHDVIAVEQASGGSINETAVVRLADGRRAFVKHRREAPGGTFTAEAADLRWLREADALRLPAVIAVGDAPGSRFLALEHVASGHPAPDHDARLGRGLAALHAAGTPAFGLDRDNFVGSLAQANEPRETWPEFYATRRLLPLTRRAVDDGHLPRASARAVDRLCARLDDLCGPPEPPARLHGDLWSGNLLTDADGGPWVVDPAAYGGHREVDLAMMRLFGGFGAGCFAAYDEALPPAAGREDRVPLYQLYPLLVHVVLFGGSYTASLRAALARYVDRA